MLSCAYWGPQKQTSKLTRTVQHIDGQHVKPFLLDWLTNYSFEILVNNLFAFNPLKGHITQATTFIDEAGH